VPSVWDVLKPSDRPQIWERASAPPPAGQSNVIMGYDTDFARAYDTQNLGWSYTTLSCGAVGVTPYLDCDPSDPDATPALQQLLDGLYGNVALSWNLLNFPILTDQQIEDRKIYNTLMYSQGNQGHEFTSVLTDTERKAIIEYLKTL
jgi:endo-cleaving rubber dioxygenase